MIRSNKFSSAPALVVMMAICLLGTSSPCLAEDPPEAAAAEPDETPVLVATKETVVTATRREEQMIDVPISVTSFSGESVELTSIREVKELGEFIPNVEVAQGNDFQMQVTIRGVGSNSRNIGFDTRVGVYVDGVYMGQSPAINQELLDLERIEVLRGPQGTLFGMNTVAGAMNLVTRKPGDTFGGKISLDVGNFGFTEFRGFVNVPLSDSVFFKVSASQTSRDGYIDNTVTGNKLNERDHLAYRGQLRIRPSDKLDVNISVDGLQSDRLVLIGEPLTDMLGAMPDPHTNGLNGIVAFDADPYEDRDITGAALDIDYRMDSGSSFRSITGYRNSDIIYVNTTDYQPIDIVSIDYQDTYDQLTQEFQLISAPDRSFTWLAGLYYYDQSSDTARDVLFGDQFIEGFITPLYNSGALSPPLPPAPALPPELVATLLGFGPEGSTVTNHGTVDTMSYAGYFNAAYELSDRVKLGFGARYSVEEKDVNWLLDGRNSGIFAIGTTGGTANPSPLIADRRDSFFAPAVSLTYGLGDSANLYFRYAAGHKSGGFNLDYVNAGVLAGNPDLDFDKETVDSFEIGLKGSFLDNRLMVGLAAFVANYDDYQISQFVDLGGGRTSIQIANAAKVDTSGFEGEFQLQAGPSVTIQGSLGLLDATFDSFPLGGALGNDVSGNELVNAPEVDAALGIQYYASIPAISSSLLLRLDATYTSGYFTTPDNVKEVRYNSPFPGTVPFGWLPERTLLHGRVGLVSNNRTWEVYLWGRNLTDEVDPNFGFRDFFGTITEVLSIGRTYGLGLDWNF